VSFTAFLVFFKKSLVFLDKDWIEDSFNLSDWLWLYSFMKNSSM
jgi:hypothetical protein